MTTDDERPNSTFSESDPVPLEGSAVPMPQDVRELGDADPSRCLVITLYVRPRTDAPSLSEDRAETFADEVLSLEQFEEQFGASDEDIDAVVGFCESVGFDSIEPNAGRCVVHGQGTVEQCSQAFHVTLKRFDCRRGKFFGHHDEVYVPGALEGIIEAVGGLDSFGTLGRIRIEENIKEVELEEPDLPPEALPAAWPEPEDAPSAIVRSEALAWGESQDVPPVASRSTDVDSDTAWRGAEEGDDAPMVCAEASPRYRSEKQSGSDNFGPDYSPPRRSNDEPIPPGYQISFPSKIARLYDFPETLDGSGETIGIISLGGQFHPSDMDTYFRVQGIKPPEIIVEPIGPQYPRVASPPGPPDKTWSDQQIAEYANDLELTLDLQVAGSIAPGAKLVVFRLHPNARQPYLTALTHALHSRNRPSVVSISYGSAEATLASRTMQLANALFARASLMGISICAASGDAGSASRDFDVIRTRPTSPHVNFPASSPYVLACGGTEIETADGKIVSECAWNDLDQCRLATAGGRSRKFERPDYQRDLKLPAMPSQHSDFDGRGLPDVAANASLASGYHTLLGGRWDYSGGTSAAAPLWAALIARINQGLGRRVGFIHPILYRLAGTDAFRDITEGSNGYFKSGIGWDACTGHGVPVGRALFEGVKREMAKRPDRHPKDPPEDTIDIAGQAQQSARLAQQAAHFAQFAISPLSPPRWRWPN
ncbi:Pseudomonalisin precursor [Stieleria neptunia]|uniref:Pseudomonalisin n=1 Tax=Stieleria neptunia TaxID=2527979 RepID=A0A518HKN2_9BACT|nr:S53 family peptidase [Stieleria neptunia]QDV41380.1 Pseudomonalisin precursor [Stieleria neptunia]